MGALPFVAFYLSLATIAGLLAAYAWRRRYYRSGRPFTLLMGAISFWCACHALAAADTSFAGTLFWSLLQYVGIVTIMPAWLLIAISYSGHWWRGRRALQIGIFIPPALFCALALTNELHHRFLLDTMPDMSRGFMWLKVVRGPLFWVHSAYAYSCFAAGIGLLALAVFRAAPIDRRHAWMMLIAALIPAVGNLAYLAGAQAPWNDDPTPILLFIGGALSFYATVHFRVIDLAPLVEREVLAALPDGLVVLNRQAVVSEINAEAIALLQLPPGQLIGMPLLGLLTRSPHLGELREALADGPGPRTHQLLTGEGEQLRAIELRLRPLSAANGAQAGTLLLLRDVSERARVEQSRAEHLAELSLINEVARAANTATETERLIRAIAETIVRAGHWDRAAVGVTRAGGGRLDIVADYAAETQRSYEGDLISGRGVAELQALMAAGHSSLLALNEPEVADSLVGQMMARAGLRNILVVPLMLHGSPLGVLVLGSSAPRDISATMTRLAETIGELITDATVRTRLYEEVRAADQLKSSFLATISHELRTPLTSIIGYTEMLQRGLYGPLGDRVEEPLGYMREASNTLLRLITDILDFSRMEAGQLKVDLCPVEPLRAIRNVIGQLQPQAHERELELLGDLPDQLPLVHANSSRLEQVLANLISNAIKFTESGSITVCTRSSGDQLRICVRDTGIGIAAEDQEAIFQEFRRVNHGDRHYSGTGLGLAISRRLTALMGGSIGVESAAGSGSTFFIDLPIITLPAESPPTVMTLTAHELGRR
ncbi:PAS domain-containing protein [Oscillochloris sp. ZM17-4]|uniref:histidine kinase N-terminal 7TM domain-containing protein n=1 Tax=Oscillochloris sp. ZM17-4 TaxID=2866714 RepID=UPI001C73DA1D|nr:histidine kinase N-terminal 7TM domain-containing protein [Oscillochloris sp. ZM17-4]MBX0327262.1 PAS domain-containing protein [Oscillochloris sp. ZM17-4]